MASHQAANTGKAPKDAQVIVQILKDMGIHDYEPRVVNQLLEFVYRYVTSILDDAKIYANHAKKKSVYVEDVKLAVQMQLDKSFTNPPPRDVLLELARIRNANPLPLIKSHCGLRLPPDRFCLTQCNYRLKPNKKSAPSATYLPQHGANRSFNSRIGQPQLSFSKLSNANKNLSSANAAAAAALSMAKPVASKIVPITKPIIKFTPGSSQSQPSAIIMMQSAEESNQQTQGIKRKAEPE